MSGRLAGAVWESDLDPKLKPLAATLADFANDDGFNVYPSENRVAWRLGCCSRKVRYGLSELRALGVLEVVAYGKGGRGAYTEYRFVASNLPKRAPFEKPRNPARITAGFTAKPGKPEQQNPENPSRNPENSGTATILN